MERKFKAVMPISAYPFHLGHVSLFVQAESVFGKGKVLILVCNNSNKDYSAYDRMAFFRFEPDTFPAELCEGLVADFCNEYKIKFIVRGCRTYLDWNYEKEISDFNDMFNLQTVFFPTIRRVAHISSSKIRELLKYDKMNEAIEMCPRGVGPYLYSLKAALRKEN